MASENREPQSEIIDIPAIIEEYISKWYLFLICIIACTGLAYLYASSHEPEYDIKANILISQDEKNPTGNIQSLLGDIGNSVFGSMGDVEDELFRVGSHSVIRDAIKALEVNKRHYVRTGLKNVFRYEDYPITVVCNPAIPDTLMTNLTFKVKVNRDGEASVKVTARNKTVGKAKGETLPLGVETPYGLFTLVTTDAYVPGEKVKETIKYSGYHSAAEDFSEKMLTIAVASKKANVISLSTYSTNTDFAKDLLNTIIAKYNLRDIMERNLKSHKTVTFIDSRLDSLTNELQQTEVVLQTFKEREGLTDLESDAAYEFTRKNTLEVELVRTEEQKMLYLLMLDFMAQPENEYSLMPSTLSVEDSEPITAYNQLILRRIEMINGGAREGNLNLKKLDDQIAASRDNLVETLKKAVESCDLMVNEIRQMMNDSDSKLSQVPMQEREFRNLMRQQEIMETLYVFLQQQREMAAMSLANSTPKAVIVDEAFAFTDPRGLSKPMLLIVAFIFGLLLAPVIIYVRNITRNKFESKEALQKLTRIPMLGEVCTSRSGDALVVRPGGSTSIAELFRLIRTNLQFILNGHDEKVVLMTSTVSGEGKSFVSINLASSLALLGKKVVLVGMDIRAPKLAEYLTIHPRHGLTEYLASDTVSLADIIIKDGAGEHLDVITAGPVPPNPSELLLTRKIEELFEQLRAMYDYVIVDSAPVGMVSDTFSLARISDATIYVCRANYTTLRDVRFFNELYAEERLKKMSLVVNGTQAKKGYGYGYGHDVDRKGRNRAKA